MPDNASSYAAAVQSTPLTAEQKLDKLLEGQAALTTTVNNMQTEFNTMKLTLEKTVDNHEKRITTAEDELRRQLQDNTDYQEKTTSDIAALFSGREEQSKHIADIYARLDTYKSQKATVVPDKPKEGPKQGTLAELKSFLASEMDRITKYKAETSNMENVVVLGPKPEMMKMSEDDLRKFMGKVPNECYTRSSLGARMEFSP